MTEPSYLTNCEQRVIDCANGAIEYLTVDIEDRNREDITGDVIKLSLGTWETPGVWHTADLVEEDGAVWKVKASLLIGSSLTYPPGTYWAWSSLADSPELIPQRSTNMLITIT
jgi:hypothetical protein